MARLLRRALAFEVGIYRSLLRWAFRRPAVPKGAEPFGYVKALLAITWLFIVLSVVEIVVVHLALPWPTARIVLLILGIWGLTWMLGRLASLSVYPHVMSDADLRIRSGATIDLPISWDDVSTTRMNRRDVPSSRTAQVVSTGSGDALSIGVFGQTNIDVVLTEPIAFRLPKGMAVPVVEVRFYADEPRDLVGRAGELLAARV